MAAPVLANRSVAFVNKVGTDDAGYNAVGKPDSYLTIAAALAGLAAGYPAASLTNPHVVAVGPGVFTTAAFALPPFTFIEGSADDESGTTSILSITGNITLASTWSVNATKNGGLANLVIRADSGTPVIDLTMPVPAAGNPTRTVELENIRTDLDRVDFEATSTNDKLNVQRLVHDGSNSNDIEFSGGTQSINNLQSGAIVTLNDTATIANACQAYGIFITNASSSLRCISTGVTTTIRLGACDNRNLFLSETAPGVITVSADAVSIPLMANVTFGGTATNADLIRTTDAGGFAGGITGPATSTLNAFVIWDNTTGSLVRDSAATLSAVAANTVTLNTPAADLLLASILGTGCTLRLGRTANGNITLTPSGTGNVLFGSDATYYGTTANFAGGIPVVGKGFHVLDTTTAPIPQSYFMAGTSAANGYAVSLWYQSTAAVNGKMWQLGMYGNDTFLHLNSVKDDGNPGTYGAYFSENATFGSFFRQWTTNTGASAYSLLYFGTSIANTTDATVGVLGSGNTGNYGGARSMIIGTNQNTPVVFMTNGAEKFRLAASGNILIGVTADGTGKLQFVAATANTGGINFGTEIFFFRTGTNTAQITATAGLTISGLTTQTGAANILNATAIPAGGTAGSGFKLSSTANFGVFFGSAAPSLAAAKGSLYLRSDGTGANDRAYINTDGGTTWTPLVTVG